MPPTMKSGSSRALYVLALVLASGASLLSIYLMGTTIVAGATTKAALLWRVYRVSIPLAALLIQLVLLVLTIRGRNRAPIRSVITASLSLVWLPISVFVVLLAGLV